MGGLLFHFKEDGTKLIFSWDNESDRTIKCIWTNTIGWHIGQDYTINHQFSPIGVTIELLNIQSKELHDQEEWKIISEEEATLIMIGGGLK